MKTKEESNAPKAEVILPNQKSDALSDEELAPVNGGLDNIPDLLKTLKEKAVAAATDTCTEADRKAIQKEIEASVAQIDDNALTTFNGKKLSNGSRNGI